MTTVFIDTTATFDDVSMSESRWKQLLALSSQRLVRVIVPEIVVLETARHWESKAGKEVRAHATRVKRLEEGLERMSQLGMPTNSVPLLDGPVAPERKQIELRIRDRLLSANAEIPTVPSSVTVQTLLERDLARRLPFDSDGKGFRDALIWETVRSIASRSEDLNVLVTGNSKDFCVDGQLAQDLVEELGPGITIVRVADLDALFDLAQVADTTAHLLKPEIDVVSFLSPKSPAPDKASAAPTGLVRAAILEAADRMAGDDINIGVEELAGHDFTGLEFPSALQEPTIHGIYPDDSTLTWEAYQTSDDETLLIRAKVTAVVDVFGFAYKSDAVHDARFQIIDWDWNDHVSQVVCSSEGLLTFRIDLAPGSPVVAEFESATDQIPEA